MKTMTTLLSLILLQSSAFAGSSTLPTADEARQSHPDLAQHVAEFAPMRNRAGQLYIPGEWTLSPEAQALLLERFLGGTDATDVRVALAYSLDDSHLFAWDDIQREADPEVRGALLHLAKARRSLEGSALLVPALGDSSAWVRSEAARLAGYMPMTEGLEKALLNGLVDSTAKTRAMSARSLGWQNVEKAFDAIVPLLQDENPEVIDHALRSLSTLDRARTRTLPAVETLSQSPYPKIAARAQALQRDVP